MRVLVILLALAIGFCAGYAVRGGRPAGNKAARTKIPAAAMEPLVKTASGYTLQPVSHDFGKLLEGERRTKILLLERPADTAVSLGRIYSPCPCIFACADKLNFGANEDIPVTVNVHSLSLHGRKSFPVYVEIVKPVRQVIRADISVNVTRVPARMLIKPSAMHLGTIRAIKTASVTLYNLTAYPVTLKTVTSSLPEVKVEVVGGMRIPAGESRVVKATAQGLARGVVRGKITIRTDCAEHLQMSVPLDGTAVE